MQDLITINHIWFTIPLLIMLTIIGIITCYKGYPDGSKALLLDGFTSFIMSIGLLFIMMTIKPEISVYVPIISMNTLFILISAFIIQRSDYYDVIIPKYYYVYQLIIAITAVIINMLIIHYNTNITDKTNAYLKTMIAFIIVFIGAFIMNGMMNNYVAMSLFMFAPVLHFRIVLMFVIILIGSILLEQFMKLVIKAAGFYDVNDNENDKHDESYQRRIINGEQKLKCLSESSVCIATVIIMMAWIM